MRGLFCNSEFNGDISQWNTSNVRYMDWMFQKSKFTGDISGWDVRNTDHMYKMFDESKFTGDIGRWRVNKVMRLNNLGSFQDFIKYVGMVDQYEKNSC
jgi:surface protein